MSDSFIAIQKGINLLTEKKKQLRFHSKSQTTKHIQKMLLRLEHLR